MTWSQAMFAYSGIAMPAAASVLGGWLAARQSRSIFKGALVAGSSVFGAICLMAGLAILCFPSYPHTPVPETGAMLLTLPCLLAGIVALRYLGGWSNSSTAGRYVLPSVLGLIWIAGAYWTYSWTTWSYRKALPWSATEIREHAWTEGFLPDFSYWMRARITEEQFTGYVDSFRLKEAGEVEASWLNDSERPLWFRPSNDAKRIYEVQDGDWSMRALYDQGYIYVTAREQ